MYRLLDLFSGIGGFSLGLERSGGFKTVAFCEIDPFCRKVLKKHWPDVPQYDDVKTLTAARLAADGIAVDAICGGFPCQDISVAGNQAGLDGERSGLWAEYCRLIGELRPEYVIVENVGALLFRGLSRVLGDLAEIGYDAEWHGIPAAFVGAPQLRERVWLVAYPYGERRQAVCRIQTVFAGETCASAWGELELGRTRGGRVRGLPPSSVLRVVNGLPAELDVARIKALGNAVVPQIPELIGRAVLAAEAA
jgi:DNA (cytosine-5)-methyltransferase 1